MKVSKNAFIHFWLFPPLSIAPGGFSQKENPTKTINMEEQRTTRSARYWTPEEDSILIDEIGKNPLNLRMCFLSTSIKVRRSPSACASRWYTHLQKTNDEEHTALVTIGKHVAVRNKKKYKDGMEMISLSRNFFKRLVHSLFILRDANGQE